MSKSFTRVRRVVVPMLTALVILSQTAPAAFAMSADDVASLAATNQQVEIIQNMPANNAAVNLSAAGASYTVLASITASEAQKAGQQLDLSKVDMSPFADWSKEQGGWWFGRDSIKYAVGMGYIKGAEHNGVKSLEGSRSVTEAEFATVLLRMTTSQADIAKYQAEHKAIYIEDATTGGLTAAQAEAAYKDAVRSNWAIANMYAAGKVGLLDGITTGIDVNTKCSRSTMARMLVNALNIRGEDTSKVDINQAVNAMSDRYTIQSSGSADAIGVAIGLGLIAGDNNKAFNPSGTMDRASMCEVLHRLDNPSGQREAVLKQSGLDGSTNSGSSTNGGSSNNGQASTAVHKFDMRTPATEFHDPKEGDIVIRPDGSEVVLKRDPTTGVLGYGQNVGVYLNAMSANGKTITAGWFAAAGNMGWSDALAGGTYIQSNLPGQESTYLWSSEWQAVQDASSPNRAGIKGTDGQVTSDGLWKYVTVAGNGVWIWQGPSF